MASPSIESVAADAWPALPLDGWRETYATLHLWTQVAASRVRFGRRYGPLYAQGKHNPCSDIKPDHLHKPILATLRNPYDWYVSQYHYRYWARHHRHGFEASPELLAEFPEFPDLSFGRFLAYYHYKKNGSASSSSLGIYTGLFIKAFFSRMFKQHTPLSPRWMRAFGSSSSSLRGRPVTVNGVVPVPKSALTMR